MQLTRTELTTHLEKLGLPVWGTDAELAQRWELNKPKAHKPAAAVSITPMGNSLLANRGRVEAPMTPSEKQAKVEADKPAVVATPRLPSVQTFNTPSDAPRRPGRPPKAR